MSAVNYKKIGERIQTLRKEKELSIADLAYAINYSPKSLVLAEGGGAVMNLDFVVPICNALDITPNDLLRGEYHNPNGPSVEENETLEELRKLVAELHGDDPNDKEKTVFKDADTAITEIKQMINEYKQKEKEDARGSRRNHW